MASLAIAAFAIAASSLLSSGPGRADAPTLQHLAARAAAGPNPVPRDQPAPGRPPIRIAIALPLTGPQQAIGNAVRQRLSLISAPINASGGIDGRALVLDIEDDACTRGGGRALAERLAAAAPPPAAVIGHPCPAGAITAAPIYQAAGILFIAAGVRHPDLTDKRAGPLVFRAAGRDDRQGADAGRRLRTIAGANGASLIIHDRTVLARALADAAREAATTDGGPAPDVLTIVASEHDYSATIARIATAQPQAIAFFGFPAEAAIILRQLRQHGLNQPLIVNDAMATDEFIDHAGALLAANVEVMMPIAISRDVRAEYEDVEARVASDAAAAFTLWRDAATATGSVEAPRIAAWLSKTYQQIEEIRFDSAGDARAPGYAPFRRKDRTWQRADTD